MAVAIQGKCCGIMPHVFLNRLDVVPCADGINRESVATIMQTMMIKPSILQCLLECLPDSRLREMTSICMRKDEVRELSLVPQVSGYTLLLFLIFLMSFQSFQHKRSRIDTARLSVFQSAEGKRIQRKICACFGL